MIIQTLIYIFGIYFIADSTLYFIHRAVALNYWRKQDPKSFYLYSWFALSSIPLAIYCWLKYGDPINIWKLEIND